MSGFDGRKTGLEDDYEGYDRVAGDVGIDPWAQLLGESTDDSTIDDSDSFAHLLGESETDFTDEEIEVADKGAKLLAKAHVEIENSVLAAEDNAAVERVANALLDRIPENKPRPRLEPTRRFAELLGMPHEQFPAIHIAGTNGKTSTSRVIESLLRAQGLKTGLITSPHLISFNERIQISGEPFPGTELERVWHDIQPALEIVDRELADAGETPITWFEALIVLSFAVFADVAVDVAVVEVGLGGDWDSTNIIDADVQVFVPIGVDHVEILGDDLAGIATAKAGIMKSSGIAVTSPQPDAALAKLREKAAEVGVDLRESGRDFKVLDDKLAVGGRMIQVQGLYATYEPAQLGLFGRHQAENAATAIAAVEAFLGREIPAELYAEGLATATSPGRLQVVHANPTVIIDSAHNPHGAVSLVDAMQDSFDFAELVFISGILGEKDANGFFEKIADVATQIIITPVNSPRATDTDVLAQVARQAAPNAELSVADDLEDAFEQAIEWAESGQKRGIVVAGSVVLAGEALSYAKAQGWIK